MYAFCWFFFLLFRNVYFGMQRRGKLCENSNTIQDLSLILIGKTKIFSPVVLLTNWFSSVKQIVINHYSLYKAIRYGLSFTLLILGVYYRYNIDPSRLTFPLLNRDRVKKTVETPWILSRIFHLLRRKKSERFRTSSHSGKQQ